MSILTFWTGNATHWNNRFQQVIKTFRSILMNKIAPVCIYQVQQISWESCVIQRRTVTPEKITKTLAFLRCAIAYIYKSVCCTSILVTQDKPVLSINRWGYHPFRAHSFYKENEPQKPQNLKKMLKKSPASNAWPSMSDFC